MCGLKIEGLTGKNRASPMGENGRMSSQKRGLSQKRGAQKKTICRNFSISVAKQADLAIIASMENLGSNQFNQLNTAGVSLSVRTAARLGASIALAIFFLKGCYYGKPSRDTKSDKTNRGKCPSRVKAQWTRNSSSRRDHLCWTTCSRPH